MAVTAVFSVATVFVAINLVIPSVPFCVGITTFGTASNCYLFLSFGCKMLRCESMTGYIQLGYKLMAGYIQLLRKLRTDYIQFDHKLIIGYIELHL